MIEKVQIKNFQSWGNVEFDLGQVTILVGPTRSGKSALTRAVKGLTYNMLGDSFVRKGHQNAEVKITFDGGKWVRWVKGEKNVYELFDGKDTLLFNKVGRAVPDEVKQQLGMWEVVFDGEFGEQMNFMTQFGDVFMLGKAYPATLVTRILGKISRINEIYTGLKLADTDLKRIVRERERLKKNLEEFKGKLVAYKDLDLEKQEVEDLVEGKESIQIYEERKEALLRIREQTRQSQKKISDLAVAEQMMSLFRKVDLSPLKKSVERHEDLTSIRDNITTSIKIHDKLLKVDYKWANLVDLAAMRKLLAKLDGIRQVQKEMGRSVFGAMKAGNTLESVNSKLVAEQSKLEELKKSVKVCPFCNRTMETA